MYQTPKIYFRTDIVCQPFPFVKGRRPVQLEKCDVERCVGRRHVEPGVDLVRAMMGEVKMTESMLNLQGATGITAMALVA
jgi:hypothetical protein